jgi:SAM-dependent methyltransferase
MDDVSNLVARQYTEYAYPEPLADVAEYIANGNFQYGEPSLYSPLLWPEGRPRDDLRILVAGCGTVQAAIYAHNNPACSVVGVDFSETSLAHERFLQEKHGLSNLHLYRGDLREVGELGREFDMIACTGVLHHLKSPEEGLRALASVLSPRGAMFLMVYGATRRLGVYLVQDMLRRLGAGQDAAGVALARSLLDTLDPGHPVRRYQEVAPDLAHDSGIVDTFLHPQDRAYTVPDVLELVEGSGLCFQGWMDNLCYHPEGQVGREGPVFAAIKKVPLREQWAVVEKLTCFVGCHMFMACRPERERRGYAIDFESPGWLDYVPVPHPIVHVAVPASFQPEVRGAYTRENLRFELAPAEALLFDAADGRRTIAQILEHTSPAGRPASELQAFARDLFERVWKCGHIFVATTPLR